MSTIVDLTTERAARKPAVTRFVLEARDAGCDDRTSRFLWDFYIEDTGDPEQWRPATCSIGQQLRRIADRYDPRPRRRRAKVTPRSKRTGP